MWGVTAAPLHPTTPVERTKSPEVNDSQQFYLEDSEIPVEGDHINESAIEKLRQLLKNSGQKGAKIKFTVDMEEKERDGRSGLRIDVWEVRKSPPASPITTRPPSEDSDPLVAPVSGKIIPRMERCEVADEVWENIIPPLPEPTNDDHDRDEQSGLDLAIDERPSFNKSQEGEQENRDYTPRKEFYDLNPACDRDVSMKSIEDNVPPLTGIGGNISPHDPNDNMSISHDDTQGNHSEAESARETESVTLDMEVDARTTNHSREENQKDNGNTPRGGTELLNISEPRDTALLDMLAQKFYVYTEESL